MNLHYKTTNTVFLIDLDGVLIDNSSFENAIIKKFAKKLSLTTSSSEIDSLKNIESIIKSTINDPTKYTWEYISSKINLPTDYWKKIHEESKDELKIINGTNELLRLIHKYKIIIVTDAVRWVAEFKLSLLNINKNIELFSQSEGLSTKMNSVYWDNLYEMFNINSFANIMYIENRINRILTFMDYDPKAIGLWVENQEHISQYFDENNLLNIGHQNSRIRKFPNLYSLYLHLSKLNI